MSISEQTIESIQSEMGSISTTPHAIVIQSLNYYEPPQIPFNKKHPVRNHFSDVFHFHYNFGS